jgi:hypothetical protein
MAKVKGEYVPLESFLEEMVSLVDARLKKQDERITALEARILETAKALRRISGEKELKIDKSVLKIMKQ